MNIPFPVIRHPNLPAEGCFICYDNHYTCRPGEKTPVSICGQAQHALHKSCARQSLLAKANPDLRLCDVCKQKFNLDTWVRTPPNRQIILQLGQQQSLSDRINGWIQRHPIVALISLLGLGALFGAAYSIIYTGFPFAGGWSFWLSQSKKTTPFKTNNPCTSDFNKISKLENKISPLENQISWIERQLAEKEQQERESNGNGIWKIGFFYGKGYCVYREPEFELDHEGRETCEQSGNPWVTLNEQTRVGYSTDQSKTTLRKPGKANGFDDSTGASKQKPKQGDKIDDVEKHVEELDRFQKKQGKYRNIAKISKREELSLTELASDPRINPNCQEHAKIILGIEGVSDQRRIRQRFLQLTKQYHPTRDPSPSPAVWYLIRAAYETLAPKI